MTLVSTFTTPILYDKIAQELNTELNALGHIDDLYPVCSMGYEEEETYPEVYKNDGSKVNFRVMPDTERSLSFFIITGDMVEIDEGMNFAVPMALVVWMNLLKVDPTKQYDYTAEIIKDVYNVLDEYGCYNFSVDVNNPFEGFTLLEKNVAQNTMRPYSAFRISFTKNIVEYILNNFFASFANIVL